MNVPYKNPQRYHDRGELAAGALLRIRWISVKRRGLNAEKSSTVFNGHIVQLVNPMPGLNEPYWVLTEWRNISHPAECTLSKTPLGEGNRMVALYCAEHQDFVGVETRRAESLDFCLLCGKPLRN